ncbi:MAG: hypothetical protein IT436_04595 [Phycisphaerales bacterium]|nr:hypothetical protein [Phycisphaerales bacterium]
MKTPLSTSDFASNAPEQIERVAKLIGRAGSHKRLVFEAVYYHKAKSRTVEEIRKKTGLTRNQVLKVGSVLDGVAFDQTTTPSGEIAYARRREYHKHKQEILALADSREKRDKWPTKRKVVVHAPKSVAIPAAGAKVKRLYIDDVASFAKVKKIKGGTSLPNTVSEDQFKQGVQRIIGEPGEFKDWPGEKSDLYTTRLRLNGKRVAAAFAFKGPGLKTPLYLGKMGKRGNQYLRLIQEEADVYFVQHWREIDPDVIDVLERLAVAKSATTGKPLWYGIIDGKDSHRLYLAYPTQFNNGAKKKGTNTKGRKA